MLIRCEDCGTNNKVAAEVGGQEQLCAYCGKPIPVATPTPDKETRPSRWRGLMPCAVGLVLVGRGIGMFLPAILGQAQLGGGRLGGGVALIAVGLCAFVVGIAQLTGIADAFRSRNPQPPLDPVLVAKQENRKPFVIIVGFLLIFLVVIVALFLIN